MIECDVCHAKSQLRLCGRCQAELKDNLANLARRTVTNHLTGEQRPAAGWLELLEDARYGTTRLGESARRSTEKNTPLVVRLGPAKNPDQETQWHDSPLVTLRNFHGTLSTWIRHLCESRGATFQPIRSVPAAFIGPVLDGWRRLPRDYRASITDCAEWLAHHVAAIACDEAAAELYRDVRAVVDAIDRLINRPVSPRYCGPCPSLMENQEPCSVGLFAAKQTDTEVICWKCRNSYNVEDLIKRHLTEVPNRLFTWSEVLDAMVAMGEPIAQSTWRRWRANGWIQAAGELYGEPGYYIDDVRELRKKYTRQAS